MVENQTGKKIKSLQPDSGMEYINDLLVKVCQVNCIIWHFTVRRNPQQNGLAEPINQTLLEKAHCMLSNVGLGKAFWAKAVAYASHLIKRLSSAVIRDKTPMKVRYGKPTNDYDFICLRLHCLLSCKGIEVRREG